MSDDAARDIDEQMERASEALSRTDYFDAERLSEACLRRARECDDFGRMRRIVLPLQEARRQIRQLAVDEERVVVVERSSEVPEPFESGVYLVQPPMIGADARALHRHARQRRVPAMVLAREPMTDAGLWPFVAVGEQTVRIRIDPPGGVERDSSRLTRDRVTGPVPVSYLEHASELLGDEAIGTLRADDPAAYRVDDLMELLEANPDHEKLHQRLEEACREAMHEPVPTLPRRRPVVDDPYGF